MENNCFTCELERQFDRVQLTMMEIKCAIEFVVLYCVCESECGMDVMGDELTWWCVYAVRYEWTIQNENKQKIIFNEVES